MSDQVLAERAWIILTTLLRLTPFSPAVDIAVAAKQLAMPKDFEDIFDSASSTRAALARDYSNISEADIAALDTQLADMLVACDVTDALSYALEGPSALRDWLLDRGLVKIPCALSESEQNYFDDALTLFCTFAAQAALDPKRPPTHIAPAVRRQGSRLDRLDAEMAAVRRELDEVREPLNPALTITDGDRAALAEFQDRAVTEVGPEVLPEHPRLPELEAAVPGGLRYPLLVLGEGGIGKSVLAGQLVKAARAQGISALLVSCNRVGKTADLDSADALDLALGKAASGGKAIPLSAWLSEPPHTGGRRLVVIDTLDLLLREDTANSLEILLPRLSSYARLAVTCRGVEWDDLISASELRSWPGWSIPFLSRPQIMDWATGFTKAKCRNPTKAAEFLESLAQSLERDRGANVFGSPLRLGMACDLYAETGALPEQLTVSELYADYWKRRVARDRWNRRTQAAQDRERAAALLAQTIWVHSDARFVEYVPPPDDISAEQRQQLRSEGIIHEIGGRLGFFHQTFAEFAVARYLTVFGSKQDFAVLEKGLRETRAGYWGIASHLSRQQMEMNRLRDVLAVIPSDRVAGLKLKLSAAAAQEDQNLLIEIVAEALTSYPEVLVACVDALEEAPASSVPALIAQLTKLIEVAPSKLTATVRTTAALIARSPELTRTDFLVGAATALMRRMADLRASVVWSETRRLVDACVRMDPQGYLLTGLLEIYRLFPDPGRAALIGGFAAREDQGERLAEVLKTVILYPYPSTDYQAGTDLLLRALGDQQTCAMMGWDAWTEMGRMRLPRAWDACQVRAMAERTNDQQALIELIDLLFDEGSARDTDRFLNTALFAADNAPQKVADLLLGSATPKSAQTASSLAQIARQVKSPELKGPAPITPLQCQMLVDRLSEIALLNPRKVWPARIALASADRDLLLRQLELLIQAAEAGETDPATPRAVMEALYRYAEPNDVQTIEPQLRRLVASQSATTRAGLDAWLAAESVRARERIESVFADRSAHGPAKNAALRITGWLGSDKSGSKIEWVVTLLDTPHGHALRLLLDALQPELRKEHPVSGLTELLVDRLKAALGRHEDAQVIKSLVATITACLELWPPALDQQERVLSIFAVFRDEVRRGIETGERSWASQAFPKWTSAVAGIGRRCRQDAIVPLTLELIESVDLDAVGNHASRPLATLLLRALTSDPLAWPTIEAQWSRSAGVRAAIMEALLQDPFPAAAQHAIRLSQDPDCPPAWANKAMKRS